MEFQRQWDLTRSFFGVFDGRREHGKGDRTPAKLDRGEPVLLLSAVSLGIFIRGHIGRAEALSNIVLVFFATLRFRGVTAPEFNRLYGDLRNARVSDIEGKIYGTRHKSIADAPTEAI